DSWATMHLGTVAASTASDYSRTLVVLKEELGDVRLDQLTKSRCSAVASCFITNRSPNYAHKTIQRMQQVLAWGVDEGLLPSPSPAARIKKPRPVSQRQPRILNAEERQRFLDCTPEYGRPLMMFYMYMGVRRMEGLGAQWRCWETAADGGGRYRVEHQLEYGGTLKRLKSHHSRRILPMPVFLAEALEEHRATCPATELGLMFPTAEGTPVHPSNFHARVFAPIVAKAKLDGLTLHHFRHGFGSHLARVASPYDLCRALGHADPGFTYKRYCSEIPMDEAAVAERLTEIMGRPVVAIGDETRAGSICRRTRTAAGSELTSGA
ncbi:MAG TPA: tyrosine-type recombinase/integrase, partial [Coriobacteriia bacterium]|nr:tyrosine-type recombinase/integrase [Coriobacteriia bacterium]